MNTSLFGPDLSSRSFHRAHSQGPLHCHCDTAARTPEGTQNNLWDSALASACGCHRVASDRTRP